MNTNKIKYPKTWHFPFSESMSSDDHWHTSGEHFAGLEVISTEKLDGECTSMYRDHIHARSLDSVAHPSQAWARRHWGQIRHNIPEGWRVCAENVYALHSIYYRNLPHYLFVIGIYDERNVCLSWDDTVTYANLLELPVPPVIYKGPWDEKKVRAAWTGQSAFETFTEASVRSMRKAFFADPMPKQVFEIESDQPIATLEPTTGEGYVVRRADEFHYDDFSVGMTKFVRANHVQTSAFWKNEQIIPNGRAS